MLLFGADYVTAAIGVIGIRVVVGDFPVVSRSGGCSGYDGGGTLSGGDGGCCPGGCSDCSGDGGGCYIGGGGRGVERGSYGGTGHGGSDTVVGSFGGQGRRGRRDEVPVVGVVIGFVYGNGGYG